MSHVTRMNENVTHMMSHATCMNASRSLHIWMSHVTYVNESCHGSERVMSHIQVRAFEIEKPFMSVSLYVYRAYVRVHTQTHSHTHTHTHTHTHKHTHPNIHKHTHTHTHACTHKRTNIYIYMYTYTYTYVHMFTYVLRKIEKIRSTALYKAAQNYHDCSEWMKRLRSSCYVTNSDESCHVQEWVVSCIWRICVTDIWMQHNTYTNDLKLMSHTQMILENIHLGKSPMLQHNKHVLSQT